MGSTCTRQHEGYDNIEDNYNATGEETVKSSTAPSPRYANYDERKCIYCATKLLQKTVGFLLFLLLLGLLLASKVSFVIMIVEPPVNRSRVTAEGSVEADSENAASSVLEHNFWRLLLAILSPSFFGLLRCFFAGWFSKSTKNYPWPAPAVILKGIASTLLESASIAAFVFYVLPKIPSAPIIVAMFCGVFTGTIVIQIKESRYLQEQENEIGNVSEEGATPARLCSDVRCCGCWTRFKRYLARPKVRRIISVIAIFLEMAALIMLPLDLHFNERSFDTKTDTWNKIRLLIMVITLLFLSLIWSSPVQEAISNANIRETVKATKGRWKAGLLTNLWRILFTIIFSISMIPLDRSVNFHNAMSNLKHISQDPHLNVPLYVNIFTSLGAYLVAWLACTANMNRISFVIPLLLSTPLSILILLLPCLDSHLLNPLLSYIRIPECSDSGDKHHLTIAAVVLLWVPQAVCLMYVYRTELVPLMKESHLFIQPQYNGPFIEQNLMLNRRTIVDDEKLKDNDPRRKALEKRIFICTTMYQETEEEMETLLESIKNVADHHGELKRKKDLDYKREFEFHVFFDGGALDKTVTRYPLQLITLLKKTFGLKHEYKDQCPQSSNDQCCQGSSKLLEERYVMPYGIQLKWSVKDDDERDLMPLYLHLKDPEKYKKKKRWSQVMYMEYVLSYRKQQLEEKSTQDFDENTYILTTDGDVTFTYEAVDLLIDRLVRDHKVGAVCGRTHPIGSGPMVWYQKFDYTIGHWFQKVAEHALGSVLCCPGCFSLFRAAALRKVIGEYGSKVDSGTDFLKKDMGEDRWLCTLLIYAGWRLEYSAAADCYTHCPGTFEEFWKQRRRWVPSTLANLHELCSRGCRVSEANDAVSIIFILYQTVMLFSSIINPSTVILIVAAGLQYGLGPDDGSVSIFYATLFVSIILTLLYGLICVYCSEETKFDVGKILTFLYTLVMVAVVIGVSVQVIVTAKSPAPTEAPLIVIPPDNIAPISPTHNSSFHNSWSEGLAAELTLSNRTKAVSVFHSVPISTWYLAILAAIFTITALLHPLELPNVFHFIWYLAALPAGYIFLITFSACNLNNQAWGTREGERDKEGEGPLTIRKILSNVYEKLLQLLNFCCGREKRPPADDNDNATRTPKPTNADEIATLQITGDDEKEAECIGCEKSTKAFLEEIGLPVNLVTETEAKLKSQGFDTVSFMKLLTSRDLKNLKIKPGCSDHIEYALLQVPDTLLPNNVPKSVEKWLHSLGLRCYYDSFRENGYVTGSKFDVRTLLKLDEETLQNDLRIRKKGHVKKLLAAKAAIQHADERGVKIFKASRKINDEQVKEMDNEKDEWKFWENLRKRKLQTDPFTMASELKKKKSLVKLRNNVIGVFVVVNAIWITATILLEIHAVLKVEGTNILGLLFLIVYGFIIVIQFIACLWHRLGTLLHYLSRPPFLPANRTTESQNAAEEDKNRETEQRTERSDSVELDNFSVSMTS